MLNIFIRFDHLIAKFEYIAMIFLMAMLTLILVAQVILRYFFSSPIFWAEDVAVQILTISTCLGISYLIYRNDMVKVDFLLSILPESMVNLMRRGIYLIGLITMAIVSFYASEWVMLPENQFVISPTTGLLKWYNHMIMLSCFYFMTLHLFVKLFSPLDYGHDYVMED